jgi:hypothetical protein
MASENPATAAILSLLVEAGGLVVIVTLAGMNDSIANLMLIFIFGLLLLLMIQNLSSVQSISGKVLNLEAGANG